MKKLLAALVVAFSCCAQAQVNQGSGAGAVQNPGSSGANLPSVQQMIGGKGDGNGVSMSEKGITVSGTTGKVAWDDDFNAGIYDPRDTRWGLQDTPAHQAAAIQAMSNQMACDLAMGVVTHARAKWPQGIFYVDNLLIAPGSSWEGVATSQGGTKLRSLYNNHQLMQAPNSMTLTCSDSNSHTDNLGQTHVAHFTLIGCANGGCVNAPGDTGTYTVGGPGNVGLQMSSTGGDVEWTFTQNFGGYGMRVDGTDAKAFHITPFSNDEWYYFGGYKGAGESLASPETSVTTTGSTSSVTLNWTAVASATGYAVYRGTSASNESLFYTTATNSFTDTGAASTAGTVTGIVSTALAAPGTITPTGSTTGGTLAAGTYFYKVTTLGADSLSLGKGWHGSIEFSGADVMADWIEAYGLQDAPTLFTYHHIADILTGGGYSHFDHLWPQAGLVGIAQPLGYGIGDVIENVRIDFARLEGFWSNDIRLRVMGGHILSSCIATNAVTLNTGQDGITPAGICNQFFSNGDAMQLSGITFDFVAGFGPTFETADVFLSGAGSTYHDILGGVPLFQYINPLGIFSGTSWEPQVSTWQNITGPTPDVSGALRVIPNDSTATNYTGFMNVQQAQDFYVLGGNANVTIKNNPPYITTCTGTDINLGTVTGALHFMFYAAGTLVLPAFVKQDCPIGPTPSFTSVSVAADPTSPLQLATKQYVDATSGSNGISGLTASCVPLAATATTLASCAAVTDNGTALNATEPLTVTDGSGVGGGVTGTEGTAPTASTSNDTFWADSAAHRWKMNNNNAGALFMVGITTAGTAGNCPKFAANGIDIVDSGGTCGAGGSAPTVTSIAFTGSTSGTVTVQAQAVAGTPTITWPTVTGQVQLTTAEVVTFSATPTFTPGDSMSRMVLTGNVTSFTMGAVASGLPHVLCFEQDGTGGHTVTPPANVHGFTAVGTTANKWSCQAFMYDAADSIWLATSAGVINQ